LLNAIDIASGYVGCDPQGGTVITTPRSQNMYSNTYSYFSIIFLNLLSVFVFVLCIFM